MDLGTVIGRLGANGKRCYLIFFKDYKLYKIRNETAQTPAYSEYYTLLSLGQTVKKSQGCLAKVSLGRSQGTM